MAKAWDTTCDHTRDNTFLRHSWLVLTSLCLFNVKVRSYLVHIPYTCVLLYVSYLKKKKNHKISSFRTNAWSTCIQFSHITFLLLKLWSLKLAYFESKGLKNKTSKTFIFLYLWFEEIYRGKDSRAKLRWANKIYMS